MTNTSRPAHLSKAHASASPPPITSPGGQVAHGTAIHTFDQIASTYPGAMAGHVIVVDPSMMPPGYVLGQVATTPREEPEEPLYVNAKQYHRILKRRAARANLEAENRLLQRGRK
ncbi:hypothetical protein BGW38_008506, partial [Lunasporangiospora selenospora]